MDKNYTTVTLPKALVDELRARYPNMSLAQILKGACGAPGRGIEALRARFPTNKIQTIHY